MRRLMETKTILGVLGVLTIGCAFVFGLIITKNVDDTTTPLITTVMGFISVVLMSFLGTRQVGEKVQKVDEKVDRVLNGEMDSKIKAAVNECLEAHDKKLEES